MVTTKVISYEYYLDRYNDNVTLFIESVVEVDGRKFKVIVEADREPIENGDVLSAVKSITRTADYNVKWFVEEIAYELAKKLGVLNKVKVTDELLFDMIVQVIGEIAKRHVENPYYCVERVVEESDEQ